MALDGAAAVLTLLTAGSTYFAWHEYNKYQAITNTPRSTVRSIAMGRTELHGTIHDDEPLKAPLTGKPAVAYTYKIRREEDDPDDPGTDWRTMKSGRDTTTCTLTDNTGSVTIDLNGVSIENGETFYERTHHGEPSNELKANLDELGVHHEGWFGGNYDMKFHETRIEPGNDVYLLGTARDNPDVEDGTATNSTDDIIVEKANNQFMIATGDEASLRSGKKWTAIGLVALSAVLVIGTLTYIIAA